MSFTDFVLAGKKDARAVAKAANPTEKWAGVSFKSLTCLDLAALLGVFLGTKDDDEVVDLMDEFEELPGASQSVELYLFPEPLIDFLAGLEEKKIPSVAKAWQASEVEVTQWDPAEVQQVLGELAKLAQQANREKRSIMLKVSGF